MSGSGQGPAIFATFIDRRNLVEYSIQPKVNVLGFNSDMRRFTGAFEFEVEFGADESVDINSHDFVEFYFFMGSQKFQIGVGFIEDFVKKTSAAGNVLQGNGRDLLAQLMLFPYKERVYQSGLTYREFLTTALDNTYIPTYLKFRNRPTSIVDLGMFNGPMIFTDVATSQRAQVVQEYAELAQNIVYLDRLGRMVVYGRDSRSLGDTKQTLSSYGDSNVIDISVRQNFSKAYTEVSVIWQGEENLSLGLINHNSVPSSIQKNFDPRLKNMYQPLYKVYSAQDLVGLAGNVGALARIESLAKAAVRKSSQNLSMPIVTVDSPYWVSSTGKLVPYEIGQIWTIRSDAFKINSPHKLVGIDYKQEASSTIVQLAFVEPDTIV